MHPCNENKDTDQLCSYCTADLRLCFRMGKYPVFFSFCCGFIPALCLGLEFLVKALKLSLAGVNVILLTIKMLFFLHFK